MLPTILSAVLWVEKGEEAGRKEGRRKEGGRREEGRGRKEQRLLYLTACWSARLTK